MSATPDTLRTACRALPNARTMQILREHQQVLEAVACNSRERTEAAGVKLLIELAERVAAALPAADLPAVVSPAGA